MRGGKRWEEEGGREGGREGSRKVLFWGRMKEYSLELTGSENLRIRLVGGRYNVMFILISEDKIMSVFYMDKAFQFK